MRKKTHSYSKARYKRYSPAVDYYTALGEYVNADWMRKTIAECERDLLKIATGDIREYVTKFRFDKFDYELVREETGKRSLEDVLYERLLRLHRNIREDLRISQLASVRYHNKGVAALCADYLCDRYGIDTRGKNREINELVESNLFVISPHIAARSREIFNNSIKNNVYYKELDRKIYASSRKLKSMIVDRIPEHMPDLYPLARGIKRHFILHVGPTNSGKTYDAIEALKKAKRGVYLAPLRLLAYEIFDRLNEDGVICDMITGEEEMFLPGATHTSSTIETLSVLEEFDVAVIDECQMIGDKSRGGAWTRALLGVCASEVHVCSDASCLDLVIRIIEECGDTYTINYHNRSVPLLFDDSQKFEFPDSVKNGDALIVFSKKSCVAVAAKLQSYNIKASMIYGMLPYDVRMNEVKRFVEGQTQVVVATDAIGMGLNLPIRRIVFLETSKFDGDEVRPLCATEVKQIAGRAGRRGIFEKGLYTSQYFPKDIRTMCEGPLPMTEKARVSIPESIIYLDYPLSEILTRWLEMTNESIYEKADLTEDLMLCKKLETLIDDKKILYDFLTIGFKSNKPFLMDIIMECARMEQFSGDDIDDDIMDLIDFIAVMSDSVLQKMSLEKLEDLYLKYDLIYAYLRKFNHREHLSEIMELKRDCSAKIIDHLANQELDVRRCQGCGEELTWNYPYKICEKCHKNGVTVKRRHRGA